MLQYMYLSSNTLTALLEYLRNVDVGALILQVTVFCLGYNFSSPLLAFYIGCRTVVLLHKNIGYI